MEILLAFFIDWHFFRSARKVLNKVFGKLSNSFPLDCNWVRTKAQVHANQSTAKQQERVSKVFCRFFFCQIPPTMHMRVYSVIFLSVFISSRCNWRVFFDDSRHHGYDPRHFRHHRTTKKSAAWGTDVCMPVVVLLWDYELCAMRSVSLSYFFFDWKKKEEGKYRIVITFGKCRFWKVLCSSSLCGLDVYSFVLLCVERRKDALFTAFPVEFLKGKLR